MKKVSFDFDGTLTRTLIKDYAKSLIDLGNEVWIVTSRFGFGKEPTPTWNDAVFKLALEIGIQKEHIHFCCMDNKANFLNGKDFVFHLDDDVIELSFIKTDSDVIPISCYHNKNWIKECNNALKLNF